MSTNPWINWIVVPLIANAICLTFVHGKIGKYNCFLAILPNYNYNQQRIEFKMKTVIANANFFLYLCVDIDIEINTIWNLEVT